MKTSVLIITVLSLVSQVLGECDIMCTAEYSPVCGSDGQTYPNSCQMSVSNCENNENVTEAYPGHCRVRRQADPCSAIRCRSGFRCEVSDDGEASCACDTMCTTDYSPVCGSDGETYPNSCNLGAHNCENNTAVFPVHPGPCRSFNPFS